MWLGIIGVKIYVEEKSLCQYVVGIMGWEKGTMNYKGGNWSK